MFNPDVSFKDIYFLLSDWQAIVFERLIISKTVKLDPMITNNTT